MSEATYLAISVNICFRENGVSAKNSDFYVKSCNAIADFPSVGM